MITIGSKLPGGVPSALERDLSAMAKTIRATLPTLARRAFEAGPDAAMRQLERALQRQWSDVRLAQTIERRGEIVLRSSDRDWRPIARALSRDAARADRIPKRRALPDGRSLLAKWTTEATGLITSVRDDAIPGLQRDILHAIEHEWSPEQLARAWAARKIPLKWGTLEGRTKVIAHHQVHDLHARIQRERATAIGATAFVWHHSGNPNPRQEHKARDGVQYEYDSPPSDGLPGRQPNCGCWAETIIDGDLMAELGIVERSAAA